GFRLARLVFAHRSPPLVHLERREHTTLIIALALPAVAHGTEHHMHARLERELRLRRDTARHRRQPAHIDEWRRIGPIAIPSAHVVHRLPGLEPTDEQIVRPRTRILYLHDTLTRMDHARHLDPSVLEAHRHVRHGE